MTNKTRLERVEETMKSRPKPMILATLNDGSKRSMHILEALGEYVGWGDIFLLKTPYVVSYEIIEGKQICPHLFEILDQMIEHNLQKAKDGEVYDGVME